MIVISLHIRVILLILVKIMEIVQIQMQVITVMNAFVLVVLMVLNVKMTTGLANQILVGITVFVMKHQIQHSNVHVNQAGQVNIVKK